MDYLQIKTYLAYFTVQIENTYAKLEKLNGAKASEIELNFYNSFAEMYKFRYEELFSVYCDTKDGFTIGEQKEVKNLFQNYYKSFNMFVIKLKEVNDAYYDEKKRAFRKFWDGYLSPVKESENQ